MNEDVSHSYSARLFSACLHVWDFAYPDWIAQREEELFQKNLQPMEIKII